MQQQKLPFSPWIQRTTQIWNRTWQAILFVLLGAKRKTLQKHVKAQNICSNALLVANISKR